MNHSITNPCILVINSTADGFSVLSLIRTPGYWTLSAAALVLQLFSTQVSATITLTPAQISGYKQYPTVPTISVLITIYGIENANTMSLTGDVVPVTYTAAVKPSKSYTWTKFTAYSFTITAPLYAPPVGDVGQILLVNFTITGLGTSYIDTPPLFNFTVHRQSIMSWSAQSPATTNSSAPPIYMFVGLNQTMTLAIDESPLMNTSININITCSTTAVNSSSSIFLSTQALSFIGGTQTLNQSFMLTGPNSTAIQYGNAQSSWTNITLKFALTGTDAPHYIVVPTVTIIMIPRSTFIVTTYPSTLTMYSNQTLVLYTTTQFGTFSSVTLSITLTFDSNTSVTLYPTFATSSSGTVTPPSFTFATGSNLDYLEPANYNPYTQCVTTATVTCMPAPTPLAWTMYIPSLAVQDVVTITYYVSGQDMLHFITPAPVRITLFNQAYINVTAWPATTLTNSSFIFNVFITAAPYFSYLTLTLDDGTGGGITCPPSAPTVPRSIGLPAITWSTTNWTTIVQCGYSATVQSQVLTMVEVSALTQNGVDAQYIYTAPNITILAVLTLPPFPIWMYTNWLIFRPTTYLAGYTATDLQLSFVSSYNSTSSSSVALNGSALPFYSPTTPYPIDYTLGQYQSYTVNAPTDLPLPVIVGSSSSYSGVSTAATTSNFASNIPPTSNIGVLYFNATLTGASANMVSPLATPTFNMTIVSQATMSIVGIPSYMYANQPSATWTVVLSAPVMGCIAPSINTQLANDCSPTTNPIGGASAYGFCCIRTCNTTGAQCMKMALTQAQNGTNSNGLLQILNGAFSTANSTAYGQPWLTWSAGSMANHTLQFTAPNTTGMITFGTYVFGDSAHYTLPAPISMMIIQQGLMTLFGLVPIYSPYTNLSTTSVGATTSYTLSINQIPADGNTVTITMTPSAGTITPSTLTFDQTNYATALSFTLLAPLLPQVVTITYVANGTDNNKYQFVLPPTSSIIVHQLSLYVEAQLFVPAPFPASSRVFAVMPFTSFNPIVNTYTFTYPYLYSSVTFLPFWSYTDGVRLSGGLTPTSYVTQQNGTTSAIQYLKVGTSTFLLQSDLDGIFTIIITRLISDVKAISIASLSSAPTQYSTMPPTKYVITPGFVPGMTAYIVVIPSHTLTFGIIINSTQPALVSTTGGLNSLPFFPVTPLSDPSCKSMFVGGGCLVFLNASDPGANTVYINSTSDGIYTIVVTTIPGYFTNTPFPVTSPTLIPSIFSKQRSSLMYLTPRQLPHAELSFGPSANVTVTISTYAIENDASAQMLGDYPSLAVKSFGVGPSPSFTWGASTLSLGGFVTFNYTLVAPTYAPPTPDLGEVVLVSYTISGAPLDVANFDIIPPFNITIFRQSVISWVNPTTNPVYMFVTNMWQYFLQIDELVTVNSSMTLKLAANNNQKLSTTTLLFTYASSIQSLIMSFNLTAMNSSAISLGRAPSWTKITVAFTPSGLDAAHFITLTSYTPLIIPRGTFTIVNMVTVGSMYSNQHLPLNITLDYSTFSSVTLTVSWMFDSGVPNITWPILASNLNNGTQQAAVMTWTTASPNTGNNLYQGYLDPLNYNAYSPCSKVVPSIAGCLPQPAPMPWLLTMPSLPLSDNVTISYTISGPDAAHYVPIPSIKLNILKQSYINVTGWPATAVTNSTFLFNISITQTPYFSVVSITLDDGTGGGISCPPADSIASRSVGLVTLKFYPSNWTYVYQCMYQTTWQSQVMHLTLNSSMTDQDVDYQFIYLPSTLTVQATMTLPAVPVWLYTNQVMPYVAVLSGFTATDLQTSYTTSYNNTRSTSAVLPYYLPTNPYPIDFTLDKTQPYLFVAPIDTPLPAIIGPAYVGSYTGASALGVLGSTFLTSIPTTSVIGKLNE